MDPPQKEVIDEVYGYIKVYSDGSVERPPSKGGYLPACPEFVNGIATKDVIMDVQTGVWARIFLPQCVATSDRKAPIVLHFHPGALCMGTPSAAVFHAFCSRMAVKSESIWVSVDYRLAPEHRLPAAYDDAYTSFMWLHAQSIMQFSSSCGDGFSRTHDDTYSGVHEHVLHGHGACFDKHGHTGDGLCHGHDIHVCIHGHGSTQQHGDTGYAHSTDPWLHAHADFSRFFLAGESSGAAIVHYLTMRVVREQWSGIRIRGLLMIHVAFLIDGVFDTSFDPTKELRQGTLRRLCLPVDAEWDHPLVNPLHAQAPAFKDVVIPPCVVAVANEDKLCAPARHYVDVMNQSGHFVELYITEGKGHCFYLRDSGSKEAELLLEHLVAFILSHSSD